MKSACAALCLAIAAPLGAAAQTDNTPTAAPSAAAEEWRNPFPLALIPGAATQSPEEQANMRAVLEFYDAALNQKDFARASAYLGNKYVQHNPTAADGPEGLRAFVEFLKTQYPQSRNEVKRVLSDGDFVVLHVHSVREPGTAGRVIGDIFRLEGGKVVEHWDVVDPIDGERHPDNPHSIF